MRTKLRQTEELCKKSNSAIHESSIHEGHHHNDKPSLTTQQSAKMQGATTLDSNHHKISKEQHRLYTEQNPKQNILYNAHFKEVERKGGKDDSNVQTLRLKRESEGENHQLLLDQLVKEVLKFLREQRQQNNEMDESLGLAKHKKHQNHAEVHTLKQQNTILRQQVKAARKRGHHYKNQLKAALARSSQDTRNYLRQLTDFQEQYQKANGNLFLLLLFNCMREYSIEY